MRGGGILLRGLTAALGALLAAQCIAAPVLERVLSRHDGGKRIENRVLIDAPDGTQPRAIVLVVPAGSALRGIRDGATGPGFGYPQTPLVRVRAQLKAQGIALAWLDPPSDAPEGFRRYLRESPAHFQDIAAVARFLKARSAGARVVLAGYADGASSVLRYVDWGGEEIDGAILVGGYLADLRNRRIDAHGVRGLVMHSVTQLCEAAPWIEARELAAQAGFDWVEFASASWEARTSCADSGQNSLAGHDAAMVQVIADWLERKPLPARVGDARIAGAWNETIHFVPHADGRMEMTLLTPHGEGPFPLVVFNHGDIDMDSTYARRGQRYRDMVIADTFLRLGFAVAQPARPGVGRSEGTYRMYRPGFDPVYKGRVHAEAIASTIRHASALPGIDAARIVIAGQSAGGFAATVIAGMGLPGVVGVVNFSGGRTDLGANERITSGVNRMMVDAFAEMGRDAKVPVFFVFAENDSRYNKETIVAACDAFSASGGKSTLVLRPPLDIDGHHIHRRPDLWRKELAAFLASLGLPRG